jgi:NAD+ diphosphatase
MLARAYPPETGPGSAEAGAGFLFAFMGDDLVLVGERPIAVEANPPPTLELPARSAWLYLGLLDETPCFAASLEPVALGAGARGMSLRSAYRVLSEDEWGVASCAAKLLRWQESARFCARCGGGLEPVLGEWSRRCPACKETVYPPVSPCIIVLVHHADRVLMVHQPGWGPMHGLVAGFVEPGESLEECVRREVKEEVGLMVDDIRYFGSQTWPFPHQIMTAFTARYGDGEVMVQASELDSAAWFDFHALPQIPPRLSIARRMLDAWIDQRAALAGEERPAPVSLGPVSLPLTRGR